jgi:uncharacterized membrane protein YtjA (UPF0391 family)
MLKWALVFGFISIVAGVFGFGGIVSGVAQAAQALFMLALSACLVSLFLGLYVIETAE